jgi:hypothetical protein
MRLVASLLDQRRYRRRMNTAALLRQRAFKPFVQPTTAPAGSFDPTLAAQVRASGRGLADLTADTGIAGTRASDDLQRNLDFGGADYQTSLSQLLRSRDRENADYGVGTQTIGRNFRNLAAGQSNRANASGILGNSGYDSLAQGNRDANQRIEQTALDTSHTRELQNNQSAQDALKTDWERRQGALNLDFSRGGEDRGNTLSRATRESGLFAQDIGEAELYQAKNSGLLPTPPPGEVTRNGLSYRQLPGKQGAILQSGRAISQSALIRMLRQRGWRPR